MACCCKPKNKGPTKGQDKLQLADSQKQKFEALGDAPPEEPEEKPTEEAAEEKPTEEAAEDKPTEEAADETPAATEEQPPERETYIVKSADNFDKPSSTALVAVPQDTSSGAKSEEKPAVEKKEKTGCCGGKKADKKPAKPEVVDDEKPGPGDDIDKDELAQEEEINQADGDEEGQQEQPADASTDKPADTADVKVDVGGEE